MYLFICVYLSLESFNIQIGNYTAWIEAGRVVVELVSFFHEEPGGHQWDFTSVSLFRCFCCIVERTHESVREQTTDSGYSLVHAAVILIRVPLFSTGGLDTLTGTIAHMTVSCLFSQGARPRETRKPRK